jgi:hypothetical protein
MRPRLLAGLFAAQLAAVAGGLAAGCATRAQPYRFASPLIGGADLPAHALPDRPRGRDATAPAVARAPAPARASTRPIRTVSMQDVAPPRAVVASAESAAAITQHGHARGVVWSRLPAPHRLAATATAAAEQPPRPAPREPADLRALVGLRDRTDPFDLVIDWLEALDLAPGCEPADAECSAFADGAAVVAWARGAGRLRARGEPPAPGDVLVFDRAIGDGPADLLAIVVARDARGVIEFVFAGGGVIRRGFADPSHASQRRDDAGAILNTFLRTGKRWPPKGTRYLAGELLAHVIRTR